MKRALKNGWNSFIKLFRFLAWYGIAVAAVLYLLPWAGMIMEEQYDALSGTVKFITIIGFFLVVGAWQMLSQRDRWKDWSAGKSMG